MGRQSNAPVTDYGIHPSSLKSRVHPLFRLIDPLNQFQGSESSFDVVNYAPQKVAPASPQSPRTAVASVRFNDDVQVHEIVHHKDMEEKEKKFLWYRVKDYKRIRKEGQATVSLIRAGVLYEDSDDDCLEGLDSETHPYARQRSLHKLMAQSLVFEEQQRQREEKINDPDFLALNFSDFCSRCRHAAFVAGLRDDRTQKRGVIN
jgi:hypothetical protein